MIYELTYNEAQGLRRKLEQLGYFASVIPQCKWYNALIHGRKHTKDMKEMKQ